MRSREKGNAHSFVYDRDGWRCQMPKCLCPDGRAIDPQLRGIKVPWAPSVDHIEPKALGGPNSRENMRAAHRLCNVAAAAELSQRLSPTPPRKLRPNPRRRLTYRIGDLFPGDQGSRWS